MKSIKDKNCPPAVVLGMTANGLSIIRSLGRKGILVIGIDASRNEPGVYSKYLINSFMAPNVVDNEENFIFFLITLGKKLNKKSVLFATADEYVWAISKYREELSPYFDFPIPSHKLVKSFLDKREAYELAKKYEVPHPNTYFVNNEEDIQKLSNFLQYPCIIKPRYSHLWREKYGSRKVFTVTSFGELVEIYNDIKEGKLEVMVQEIIPGKDSNIYELMAYFDEDSNPLSYFCCHKLRQYPPNFGIGCFSESKHHDEIINLGLKFLKDIGYNGIVHIEFKINSLTGQLFFLETNVRTSFIGELSIASGVNLPYIAYSDLAYKNNAIANKKFNFKEGIKLLNLELDLGSYWRYRKVKQLNLRQYLNSFNEGRIVHTYFAIDDLFPFIFVIFRFTKIMFKKFLFYIGSFLKKVIKRKK